MRQGPCNSETVGRGPIDGLGLAIILFFARSHWEVAIHDY